LALACAASLDRRSISGAAEPGRVEQVQVVVVDRRAIAAAQRVAGEQNRERCAGLEPADLGDDLLERDRVAVVPVDGVQAGRPAGRVVGLRLDLDRKAGAPARAAPSKPAHPVYHSGAR
jgi:hypothetical protein